MHGFESHRRLPEVVYEGRFSILAFGRELARVAELVYAHDLKSCAARLAGSSPAPGTFLGKQ